MRLNELISATGPSPEKLVQMLHEATYVGIDFGTSTTTVTRLEYDEDLGRIVSVELPISQEDEMGVMEENHLVPTVIAMLPGDGRLIYGLGAKRCLGVSRGYAEGYNYWSEFKMHLGECACYPNTRRSKVNTPVSGDFIETPKDAATHFFGFLRGAIEMAVEQNGLPKDVRYAVTVPASFAPNQRKELCDAIQAAGICLNRGALLDEPNAAFMAAAAQYAEEGGSDVFFRGESECRVLVFDFGAGTCDISLLGVMPDMRIRNIAISRFTALGGRDIDMRIATDFLYPQLIAGRRGDDVPVKSVREGILNTLRPVAEKLKIRMSRKFTSDFGERAFQMANEQAGEFLEESVNLPTKRYGDLSNPALRLSAGEFRGLMEEFSEDPRSAFENGRKSILEPIVDVLRKGNLTKQEVDFVLMVGGSSENPFVRESIEDYFAGDVQLSNLNLSRTLVARGAAFHSLAVNGLHDTCITPITSEDIVIRTDQGEKMVVRAGASVPTEAVLVEGLYVNAACADEAVFGIPFYARSGDRKIGTAKFTLANIVGEKEVRLTCSLTSEKVFVYEIEVDGRRFAGQFDMPISSEDTSPDEIAYIRATNALKLAALVDNGTPPVRAFVSAAKACEKVERHEETAEFYRDLMYAHRQEHYEAEVAKGYREAGKRQEALEWARRAYAYRKSSYNIWYLIWDLAAVRGWGDEEVGRWVLEANTCWPDDADFHYVDMKYLAAKGARNESRQIAEELYEHWCAEGVENIDRYQLPRFETVAQLTGHTKILPEIAAARKARAEAVEGNGAERKVSMVRMRNAGEDGK